MRFGTLMAGEDLIRHVIGGTGEVDEFLDWPNPRLDVEPPWALATGLFWRVVVDDTAVTPRYVTGFTHDRELPIFCRITQGSLGNKLLFTVPVSLFLSTSQEPR